MGIRSRSAAVLLILGMVTAPAAPGRAIPPGPSHTITAADLARSPRTDLLDFVRSERPMWMHLRGPQMQGGGISVFLNGMRIGGVEELATLPTAIVREVRHYRGSAAVLRYGPDHADGVIAVATEPAREILRLR